MGLLPGGEERECSWKTFISVLFDPQGTKFIIWNPRTSEDRVYLENPQSVKPFRICTWLMNSITTTTYTHKSRHFLEQKQGSHRKSWWTAVLLNQHFFSVISEQVQKSPPVSPLTRQTAPFLSAFCFKWHQKEKLGWGGAPGQLFHTHYLVPVSAQDLGFILEKYKYTFRDQLLSDFTKKF